MNRGTWDWLTKNKGTGKTLFQLGEGFLAFIAPYKMLVLLRHWK